MPALPRWSGTFCVGAPPSPEHPIERDKMPVSKIVHLPTASRGWEVQEPIAPVSKRHHATELVVRNVSKSFNIDRKPLPVLQDINLPAQPGRFITIVGPSG